MRAARASDRRHAAATTDEIIRSDRHYVVGCEVADCCNDIILPLDMRLDAPVIAQRHAAESDREIAPDRTVGIKQTDDRIWLVSFMEYDLGDFDDETCRLEPLANLFGPSVIPE